MQPAGTCSTARGCPARSAISQPFSPPALAAVGLEMELNNTGEHDSGFFIQFVSMRWGACSCSAPPTVVAPRILGTGVCTGGRAILHHSGQGDAARAAQPRTRVRQRTRSLWREHLVPTAAISRRFTACRCVLSTTAASLAGAATHPRSPFPCVLPARLPPALQDNYTTVQGYNEFLKQHPDVFLYVNTRLLEVRMLLGSSILPRTVNSSSEASLSACPGVSCVQCDAQSATAQLFHPCLVRCCFSVSWPLASSF